MTRAKDKDLQREAKQAGKCLGEDLKREEAKEPPASEGFYVDGDGPTPPWWGSLKRTAKGGAIGNSYNVAQVLALDEAFANRIVYDELHEGVMCRDLPWAKGGKPRPWTDSDTIKLSIWLQARDIPAKVQQCDEAVQSVAEDHRQHAVVKYLRRVKWDGVERLSTWLEVYLGAGPAGDMDQEAADQLRRYLRAVGRAWMISAVARAFKPGCQADHALVLEGDQGLFKTSAMRVLVYEPSWYSELGQKLGTKEAAEALRSKWIVELSELAALSKAEIEHTKQFLSAIEDYYRPSYGRRARSFPRRCVFVGTTNAETYLLDETGARRFWPVKVGVIDLEGLGRDRDQLWAEAAQAFRKAEKWHLDQEIETLAKQEQHDRRKVDPWEKAVLERAKKRVDAGRPVTVPDLIADLNIPFERQDQRVSQRVGRILKANGWTRVKRGGRTDRWWAYEPPLPPAGGPGSRRPGSQTDQPGPRKAEPDHTGVPGIPGVPVNNVTNTRKEEQVGSPISSESVAQTGGAPGTRPENPATARVSGSSDAPKPGPQPRSRDPGVGHDQKGQNAADPSNGPGLEPAGSWEGEL